MKSANQVEMNYQMYNYQPTNMINWYQENCRIYLDEYDIDLFDTEFTNNRFLRKQ